MNISDFFNIGSQQPNLEFVDVKLETDNALFVDPRLIEVSNSPLMMEMQKHLEVYWGELIKSIRMKSYKQSKYLLSGLSEPNETRLGYAYSKPRGNSVGKVLKEQMFHKIKNNITVKTGVLSHFADMELFFDEIGADRISDMTTKIVKAVLIKFTQEQCVLHGIPTKEFVQRDIFDFQSVQWVTKKVQLPEYNGLPIIFVPKDIVRLDNSASSNVSCFYRYAISHFIKHDSEMLESVAPSGKKGKILIKDIKKKYPQSKDSLSNWSIHFGKLLVDYKSNHLSQRLKSLTDDEISKIVYGADYNQAI